MHTSEFVEFLRQFKETFINFSMFSSTFYKKISLRHSQILEQNAEKFAFSVPNKRKSHILLYQHK